MWRLMDCNKSVGTHIKVNLVSTQVESYKNHLNNLKNVRSGIKI